MRFKDLARCIEACSDRVLVERLKELEQDGIVKRTVNKDTGIISYSLTEKGLTLSQSLIKFMIGQISGPRSLQEFQKRNIILVNY